MNPETKLQRAIMLALSEAGYTIWRNETGQFWTGQQLHRAGDQITLANASMVPCGLCKGSSDLIGIGPGGRFLALEVKTQTGRATVEQQNYINQVNARGGIAGIVRSVEDALALVQQEET